MQIGYFFKTELTEWQEKIITQRHNITHVPEYSKPVVIFEDGTIFDPFTRKKLK